MQYGNIDGIDKPISRLVHGTIMLTSEEEEWSFKLLDAVYDNGITAFDTGHIYGGGDPERILGRWMKERGNRDRVVLLGKGAHHNADRRRVTPFDVTADLHDSLARFQVDYIDIYVLHRDDPSVPVGPIVEVLNEHIQAGKIGKIGGSNWSHERLQEANAYAEANGLQPFAVSSPNFSLAEQAEPPWSECITISGPENAGVRSWYEESQMPLFTWSSIANGFFSGRLTRANFEEVKDQFDESSIRAYCTPDNFDRLDRVEKLAADKSLTVPQVALAYVLNQPLNIFALVGARSRAECDANLEVLSLELTQAEMDWLDLRT